jgi:AAA domain
MLEPDRDQIEMFVDAIFCHAGSKGFVSLRSFFEDDDAKPARITGTELTGGLRFLIEVAEDDARRAAQHPRPVVFCPPLAIFANKSRAREQDILAGLVLSVECDERPQQARANLEQILGPATVVVKSGGHWINGSAEAEDKLHLHWRLAQPAYGNELAKLKQVRDLAARLVGGDLSNKPICHPIRWPGSWHRKAEPRLCEIIAFNPDREIDLDTALAALKAAAPSTEKPASSNGERSTQDSWETLVADIVAGKSYHAALVSLAARLIGSNMHDGTAVKLLRALMAASTEPHEALRWQSRYDSIPRIVSSAREKFARQNARKAYADDTTTENGFGRLRWHGDADQNKPRAWLIDGLLPEIGSGLASGQWGTYKTFVALDLAAAIMGGGHFIEHAVARRGGVLYLAVEGAVEIPIRLQAVLETKYPDVVRAPFAWTDQCPPLLDPDSAEALAAMASKAAARMQSEFSLPLVLVVVDTIVAAAGFSKSGEENDAALGHTVMRRLAVLAQTAGAFVLAIDHFGKVAETGTRGSSAKEAAADIVLALLGDKAITGVVTNMQLALRKSRAGASGQEFPFTVRVVDLGVDDNGRPSTSLVVDWLAGVRHPSANKSTTGWSKSLRLLQRALMTVLVDHGHEQRPFADGPTVRAVDVEIARAEFYKSYPADGDAKQKQNVRRQAFNRALRDAQARSLIGVREIAETTMVWLVQNEGAQ